MIVILEVLELVKPGRGEFRQVLSEKTNIFFQKDVKRDLLIMFPLLSIKKNFL